MNLFDEKLDVLTLNGVTLATFLTSLKQAGCFAERLDDVGSDGFRGKAASSMGHRSLRLRREDDRITWKVRPDSSIELPGRTDLHRHRDDCFLPDPRSFSKQHQQKHHQPRPPLGNGFQDYASVRT
uniref:Uncharacterized protein n=1 Tax=Vespula pensylvanica TaxID=30213 RepID=A0A834KS87_VESPE|nr:hypothetical protein H0235_012975 [Vespula pensylvanica]